MIINVLAAKKEDVFEMVFVFVFNHVRILDNTDFLDILTDNPMYEQITILKHWLIFLENRMVAKRCSELMVETTAFGYGRPIVLTRCPRWKNRITAMKISHVVKPG